MSSESVPSASNNGGAGDADVEAAYRPPAPKSVEQILAADAEDESLRRYKETLLGQSAAGLVIEADNAKNVLVRSLTLITDERPEITMDLSDVSRLEKQTFVVKEACAYRLRINFHVQREIVAGLKYVHGVSRLGVPVDKEEYMVGSYGPKSDIQSYTTPVEHAPSGMLHRGTYKVKSLFTDDDGNEWLGWQWNLEIKKDWDE